MIGLTVDISNQGRVTAILGRMARPDLREAGLSMAQLLVSQTQDNIDARTGPTGAWPRSGLSDLWAGKRTWNDIRQSIHGTFDGSTITVGSAHIAAAVRQLGTLGAAGTMPDIVPVAKKALTIPVSEAASRASYQGKTARQAFPDAFILKRKADNNPYNFGVIARTVKASKGGRGKAATLARVEVLYLLVSRVAIRPHPFLPVLDGQLAPASLWDRIEEMLVRAFVLGEGGGA